MQNNFSENMKELEIKSVTVAANIVTPHTETAIKDNMTIYTRYKNMKIKKSDREYLCTSKTSPIEHNILPKYEFRRKRNQRHLNCNQISFNSPNLNVALTAQ